MVTNRLPLGMGELPVSKVDIRQPLGVRYTAPASSMSFNERVDAAVKEAHKEKARGEAIDKGITPNSGHSDTGSPLSSATIKEDTKSYKDTASKDVSKEPSTKATKDKGLEDASAISAIEDSGVALSARDGVLSNSALDKGDLSDDAKGIRNGAKDKASKSGNRKLPYMGELGDRSKLLEGEKDGTANETKLTIELEAGKAILASGAIGSSADDTHKAAASANMANIGTSGHSSKEALTLANANLSLEARKLLDSLGEGAGELTVVDRRASSKVLGEDLKAKGATLNFVDFIKDSAEEHSINPAMEEALVQDAYEGILMEDTSIVAAAGSKVEQLRGSIVKEATKGLGAKGETEARLMPLAQDASAATKLDVVKGSAAASFQELLSSRVKDMAGDIAAQGKIVLNSNNTGTINLVLHPESLGNVKLRLTLADKVITGDITVASREAWEAFKEGIPELRKAFEDTGFDTAGFNLSFSGGRGQGYKEGFGTEGQGQEVALRARGHKVYSDEEVSIGDAAKSSLIGEATTRILDVVA